MAHPGRNNIYDATIKRMVTQALEAQEQEFLLQRSTDSDEQLLDYLRDRAAALKHTPWPREIVGGRLLQQRFGSWQNAVLRAKLPAPSTPDKISGFARIQEETERQKMIYREKKAAKKQRAQQRMKAQKEKQAL